MGKIRVSSTSMVIKVVVLLSLVSLCLSKKHDHDDETASTRLDKADFHFYNLLQQVYMPMVEVSALSQSSDFDFFYFVQTWPGSYCDTKKSCCYPTTGKPASDFSIHGLWPNYNDGSYPSNCDPDSPFVRSKVTDLLSRMESGWPTLACPSKDGIKFWTHEWEKHGTCSESALDQHEYFQTALDLKNKINLLEALTSAGIKPNGETYSLTSIKEAIKRAVGFAPFIECNVDTSRNSQLYQVYLCVDNTGSQLIECPIFPRGRCSAEIEFPTF